MKNIIQEYEALINEATMDCYSEEECISGFAVCIEDNLNFPMDANIIGVPIKVISVDLSKDGRRLVARITQSEKKYNVDLLEVDFPKDTVGLEWIEAYKAWFVGN